MRTTWPACAPTWSASQTANKALVALLKAALELRQRAREKSVDKSFAAWWDHLAHSLATADVIPTEANRYRSSQTALLWGGHEAEASASGVLAALGVDLIAASVRAEWFLFRQQLVIRQLNLEHVVQSLTRAEAIAPDGWASGCPPEALTHLWRLLDHLLSTQGRFTVESREALSRLPIFPLINGTFGDASTARSAMPGTQRLLADAQIVAPLLADRLHDCPKLSKLVGEVSPEDMVAWIQSACDGDAIPPEFDVGRFLDWFTNRDDAVLAAAPDRLRNLPIFPTGRGFRPLGSLALPVEGFRDPLDLADVLHLEGRPAATRAFLQGLGAPELTLTHYCTEFVVRAVESGIDDSQRRALVNFLATELSRIQDDVEVQKALADLPLVLCTDGVPRVGGLTC